MHRLIAKTWIPNPDNKPTVNHLSHVRNANAVPNLEWCSYAEQSQHARTGKRTNNKTVFMLDPQSDDIIASYDTLVEASLAVIGSSNGASNISSCARGKSKTAFGFKWQYPTYADIEGEEWAPVEGERYVSNKGRARIGPRLLRTTIDNHGYLSVFGGKSLHVLVATAFIPNLDNLPCVNHKDGDKQNPDADNLEWTTHAGNAQHAVSAGLRSNVHMVAQVDSSEKILGVPFESASAAGRALEVNISSVTKCCRGETMSCGQERLVFRYVRDGQVVTIQPQTKQPRQKPTRKAVEAINKDGLVIAFHKTIEAAARYHKVNSKTVVCHCNGTSKHPDTSLTFRFA